MRNRQVEYRPSSCLLPELWSPSSVLTSFSWNSGIARRSRRCTCRRGYSRRNCTSSSTKTKKAAVFRRRRRKPAAELAESA
nr:hypothetical protein Iba_chr11bCG5300 [Ipomoea batatas]